MKFFFSLCLIVTSLLVSAPASALEMAPSFALMNENGDVVSLDSFRGKTVVLEWTNPSCPFVRRHYKEKTMVTLAQKFADKGIVWLAINSTRTASIESNLEWKEQEKFPYPILDDHTGTIGRAYGAKTTPHLFVVNAEGLIAYQGAIDNDPEGDLPATKRTNYVDMALTSIILNRPPSKLEVAPYGCSVKYAPQ